jgi:serine/threonine protein phosphatase PrpC
MLIAPNKLNQDTYCIHENFGGVKDQAFFGVFDGHGKAGTECSHFIRNELPRILLNTMKVRKTKTLKENLVAAHLNTNTMVIHKHPQDVFLRASLSCRCTCLLVLFFNRPTCPSIHILCVCVCVSSSIWTPELTIPSRAPPPSPFSSKAARWLFATWVTRGPF